MSDRSTPFPPDRAASSKAVPHHGLIKTTVRGYRRGSSPERAGLGMLSSFAVTVGTSRGINYIRERRRSAPRLRSWARRAYHWPGQEQLRVHHFVPGIGLAFLAGAGAIIKREDHRELWFSIPFGTGVGLTCDEIAIMTELDNPYWESEKLAVAQAASAALGALALSIRLHYRGARNS
jgi:hypothetical protein